MVNLITGHFGWIDIALKTNVYPAQLPLYLIIFRELGFRLLINN